jgi:ParB family transcriptional regulator, chromosome partitioning protein
MSSTPAKKRGLGKGLSALLGSNPAASEEGESSSPLLPREGELRQIPLDLLQRGLAQPRIDMHPESLEELASSIRAQGVVQPIVVRPLAGGRYEIIAGERRWRAAQMAMLAEIPAIVREVGDDAAIAIALIENIQREELNPLEEANALQRLINEFGLTHQQAADAVGRSRAAVTNLLRLRDLASEVKRLLENGDLEMGHARALLSLGEAQQCHAARLIVQRGLSVRETEALVRRLLTDEEAKPTPPERKVSADVAKLQQELGERLGAQVEIRHSPRGKGKLVVSYNSLDELDGILAHIR